MAVIFLAVLISGFSDSPAFAQDLFLKDQIGDFGNIPNDDPVAMTSSFKIVKGKQRGILSVTATIAPNWHVFSMTKTKGPVATKIKVEESADYKLIGKFKPDRKPHVVKEEGFAEPSLEFEEAVTWSAPIELTAGVNPEDLTINLVFNGQTCEKGGSCRQISFDLESEFDKFDDKLVVTPDFVQPKVKIEDFRPKETHTKLKARLIRAAGTSSPIKPGEVIKLEITATPDEGHHVYSYLKEKTQYMSTVVGFSETNGWTIKGPQASAEPDEGEAFDQPAFYHHDPVTWTFFVVVPTTAEENKTYPLKGSIGFQTCTETNCDAPTGATFEASIPVGTVAVVPVKWENASYGDATKGDKAQPLGADGVPADEKPEEAVEELVHLPVIADTPEMLEEMLGYYNAEEKINFVTLDNAAPATLWTAIFGAFVGGMLLNLMPCVFPVLGLKVMGFVMQAGSDAKKIRNHGIAFTAGLVVSMWILAGFILFVKIVLGESVNWGQQMGNPYFVCGIIVLLFLLGLNMAGVLKLGRR